jgi:hypothetical protein
MTPLPLMTSPSNAGHSAQGMWFNMTALGGATAVQAKLLLGGETSMWQDEYVGSCMFPNKQDANFSESVASACVLLTSAGVLLRGVMEGHTYCNCQHKCNYKHTSRVAASFNQLLTFSFRSHCYGTHQPHQHRLVASGQGCVNAPENPLNPA